MKGKESVEEYLERGGEITKLPYLMRKRGPEKKRKGNRGTDQTIKPQKDTWRGSYQDLKSGGFSQ